jgi:hypothetical protein
LLEGELCVHHFALARKKSHADAPCSYKAWEKVSKYNGNVVVNLPISMGVRRRESSASLHADQWLLRLPLCAAVPVLGKTRAGSSQLGLLASEKGTFERHKNTGWGGGGGGGQRKSKGVCIFSFLRSRHHELISWSLTRALLMYLAASYSRCDTIRHRQG